MLTTPPPTRPYHLVMMMDGLIFKMAKDTLSDEFNLAYLTPTSDLARYGNYPPGALRRLVFAYAATPAFEGQRSRLRCPPRASDRHPVTVVQQARFSPC